MKKREEENIVLVGTQRPESAAELTVRAATADDVDALAAAEAEAFPPAEASPRAQFAERVARYPNHFWLMLEGSRLVAFVTGPTTDSADLEDEMFKNAGLHDERGAWQMILSVVTVPDCRGRGLAGRLLRRVIADARAQGRQGLVLTCKDHLVAYYAKFGFVDEGIGKSRYGGVLWHQMRLKFASGACLSENANVSRHLDVAGRVNLGSFNVPFIHDEFASVSDDCVALAKAAHPDVFGTCEKPTAESERRVQEYIQRSLCGSHF